MLSKRETRELYDRYGHAGLRSGGFRPTAVRLRQPRRPLLGLLRRRPLRRRRPRAAAAATSPPRSRSSCARPRRRAQREVPFQVAVTCARCDGGGAEPGTDVRHVPDVRRRRPAAAGLAQRLRRVRPHAGLPAPAAAPAASSRRRAASAAASGRVIEERALDVEIPAGIHDGQRIRISGEGHAGVPAGAPATSTSRPRPARPALRPRGRRHLLDRRPDDHRRPRSARR